MATIPAIPDDPPRDRQGISAPYETQISNAMLANGVTPPAHILMDGRLHRWGDGTTKGKKPFWYRIHGDGHPSGAFGDWRAHDEKGVKWVAESTASGQPLTPAELAEIDARIKAREEQKIKDQAVVAKSSATIWINSKPAPPDHPYLVAKKIKPHGARTFGDRLVVPIFNAEKNIISLQFIDGDGEKRFKTGGATSGGMWMVGEWGDGTIYIAEGFATAVSIHEATGGCVVVAYTASNLVAVAGVVRGLAGAAHRIVIVADRDESGTGEKWARKAEVAYGVDVVVSPFGDANDFVTKGGDLAALLAAPSSPSPDPEKAAQQAPAPKTEKPWLLSLDELVKDRAPVGWLVKNWIQEQTLIMVHAPASAGKTFFVLDLCCHVASGKPDWAGHRVKKSGVVYLAGEGFFGIKQRAAAWAQEHGVSSFGDIFISDGGLDLDTTDGLKRVIAEIKTLNFIPKLIVVDTVHKFYSGDENSSRDVRKMTNSCEGLMKELGCSVCLVHHEGSALSSQGRARGSSSWGGAIGIGISLEMDKKIKGQIHVRMYKAKDSEPAAPKSMTLKKVAITEWLDEDGEQVWSLVPVISDGIERVHEEIDEKLDGFKADFRDAWQWSGGELKGKKPYVSRNAMERFLEEQRATPESTARLHASGTKKGHIINYLIANKIIRNFEAGWVIIDDDLGMICTMIAKGNK